MGMDHRAWRLVGVLGGMGPLATIDFLAKVISETPAHRDQDHLPLIVHQVPQIPDRSSAIADGSDAPLLPMLKGLRMLARAGADFAVIPCNTAHCWYEEMSQQQHLPIIHIAEAVRLELVHRGAQGKRIALMATRGTHKAGVYSGRLGPAFEPLIPMSEGLQALVDLSIAEVKGGNLVRATQIADAVTDSLFDSGADMVVLGCTELPLALACTSARDRCIDSTLALARRCVKEARIYDTSYRLGER